MLATRLHALEVFAALVQAELRDRRDLTAVGFLKWLLEPVLFVGAYFVLVGVIFQRGTHAFPLFLMCALLPWRYFQQVVSRSMGVINSYSNIVGNRAVPKRVLPIVLIAVEGINFVLALPLLVPLMAFYRVPPTIHLVWLPVVVAVLALLVSGPAFLAAIFGLYFPDFRGAAQSFLRAGFLISTALVARKHIPGDTLRWMMLANPLSGVFDATRDVVLRGRAPAMWHLLYPATAGAVMLAVGLLLYSWRQFEFAKEI